MYDFFSTHQLQVRMDVIIPQYHFTDEQTETQNSKAKSKRSSCLFMFENCLRLLKVNSSWSVVKEPYSFMVCAEGYGYQLWSVVHACSPHIREAEVERLQI